MSVPTFGDEEINEAIDSLKSGFVTMGKKCAHFEHDFARYINKKHAIFVNSGSTANLLIMAVLQGRLKPGDEVIVPALTWSTTLWPVIQMGFMPVLVDCIQETLCIDPEEIRKNITERTKAVFIAHILGNGCDMDAITEICDEHDLILLEDTCESLGTTYRDVKLGTFGLMGSYSFFFSHHITTIEGGMIVTDDDEIADKLRSMRAHGWTRDMRDKSIERQYPDIDPRFMFANLGYSVRPTEIQGAFGIHQLKKLDYLNELRIDVAYSLRNILDRHVDNIYTTEPEFHVEHTWFGMPIIVNKRNELSHFLSEKGIDSRPIVAGNLARHPALKNHVYRFGKLDNADDVMYNGIYIPCHPYMTDRQIDHIGKALTEFYQ